MYLTFFICGGKNRRAFAPQEAAESLVSTQPACSHFTRQPLVSNMVSELISAVRRVRALYAGRQ